jgi:transcriptional regulator with XRE-family HTH domain
MKIHPYITYRKKFHLTQIELGQKLGISNASVSRIEQGKQEITPYLAELSEMRLGIPRFKLLYPNDVKLPKSYLGKLVNIFFRKK